MKIMSIGDIHGSSIWKEKIFGSIKEYERWRYGNLEGDFFEGGSLPVIPTEDYDLFIFVGDYVDSFSIKNTEMKKNLEDIIHFKKSYPHNVILLLGNHDIQYIISGQNCSGFRPEMLYDFKQIFTKNLRLFQIAYLHIDEKNKKTLWTHAGITLPWYQMCLNLIQDENFPFKEIFDEIPIESIDKILNRLWELEQKILFWVDSDSGGSSKWAGPLWVRPKKLIEFAIPGHDQVVGHTPHPSIETKITKESVHSDSILDTLFFIDCLEYGDKSVLIKYY